jgi:hypothetical protein
MASKTAVYGGNQAYFFALTTNNADCLGAVEFAYNKLGVVTKTDHPNLGTYALSLQNADLTPTQYTFIADNLVEVVSTTAIDIQYNNNTKDSISQAPPDTTQGILISASGNVADQYVNLHILHGYLSSYAETDDSNGTPIFATHGYTSVGANAELTITQSKINTYFSNLGTKTGNVVLATGERGAIASLAI